MVPWIESVTWRSLLLIFFSPLSRYTRVYIVYSRHTNNNGCWCQDILKTFSRSRVPSLMLAQMSIDNIYRFQKAYTLNVDNYCKNIIWKGFANGLFKNYVWLFYSRTACIYSTIVIIHNFLSFECKRLIMSWSSYHHYLKITELIIQYFINYPERVLVYVVS